MNDFSFYLIMSFGFLFSFIFKNLLIEAGLKKEQLKKWHFILILPFLVIVGFFLFPLFFYGRIDFNSGVFNDSILFYISLSFLIGGIARFIYDYSKK